MPIENIAMSREITIISSFTKDLFIDSEGKVEEKLGGPAFYASVALESLGGSYTIVCSPSRSIIDLINIRYPKIASKIRSVSNCKRDFTFIHRYSDSGDRESKLVSRGCNVPLPRELFSGNEWVIVSPVMSEIPIEFVKKISSSVDGISLDVQGFIRESGRSGAVRTKPQTIKSLKQIGNINIIHASYEEVSYLSKDPKETLIDIALNTNSRVTALTHGKKGSYIGLYRESRKIIEIYYIPAYVKESPNEDPTGCGDIYLATLTHYIVNGMNPIDAGLMASIVAGIRAHSGLPTTIDSGLLRDTYLALRRSVRSLGEYGL